MKMGGKELWIGDGRMVERPSKPDGTEFTDKHLLDNLGMVRISYGEDGTSVRWDMANVKWSSLMLTATLMSALTAPYTFQYFNGGWFTEVHACLPDAAPRIETLLFKSDVRLSMRAYTSVPIPDLKIIPDRLRNALESGTAPDDASIVCTVDAGSETCKVDHIGSDTLIARIWGFSPNSFPCMSGHSYDRAVTPEYFRVASSGRLHYDHVLASMVRPDGERHWFGYHRVILPDLSPGRKRVRVVTEFAPVDIQIL